MPHRPSDAPYELRELRLLDGPNLYFSRAACKVVLDISRLLEQPEPDLVALASTWEQPARSVGGAGTQLRARYVARLLVALTRRLAGSAGTTRLAVRSRPGPGTTEVTVAFPWRRRGKGQALGVALGEVLAGVAVAEAAARLAAAEAGAPPATPRPRIPVVAVTGTNGKTTTTRLIAHMSRCAGRITGWSSTDGIFLDGVCVEAGDWSGYGGAGAVLAAPAVELAVLETARGGLLLRGAGAQWNDVSVVTNVGADHLGMHGITTVDQLAEVKGVVPRITRDGGWCVLNAEDPRVLGMRKTSRGRPWVFALAPDAPGIRAVLEERGRAMTVLDETVCLLTPEGDVEPLLPLVEIPMTLYGLSRHDTANALAATAAGLAAGLPRDAVLEGLRTFGAEQNPGRMNLWELHGSVVVLDMAHNEESLASLLRVASGLRLDGGRIVTVLGTAGDRLDEQIVEMGHLAGHGSDDVVIAQKEVYLRGRSPEEMAALLQAGIGRDVPAYDDEMSGLRAVLPGREPADVVVLMCHADREGCEQVLVDVGAKRLSPEQVRDRVLAARD